MKNILLVIFVRNLVLLVLKKTSRLLSVRSVFAVLSIIILYLTFNIEHCEAQWVQMSSGMGNINFVNALSVRGNDIFAGTEIELYFSTNNGSNWIQTGFNKSIYSLAVSENNIFAGTFQQGVWLSTNSGQNWIQTALNNYNIFSLAVSGNTIFAGTHYDVWLSTNNGQNWTQTALNKPIIFSLAVYGNNIFAGTGLGVWLSTNNGPNWMQTDLNKESRTFAISGNIIFAGTWNYGVYQSTDNGQNWTQTSLNNQNVLCLAISGNNIFAGTYYNGVYHSTNNGQSWTHKNLGFNPVPPIRSLLVANNYIFAGTDNHLVWRRSLSEIIGIKNISTEIPSEFSLEQNYPNPFNQSTMFKFQCSMSGMVKVSVYDILGKKMSTLVNEKLNPGTYEVRFDAKDLPSGIFFYRMETEKFSETKKLIILK